MKELAAMTICAPLAVSLNYNNPEYCSTYQNWYYAGCGREDRENLKVSLILALASQQNPAGAVYNTC